MASLSEARGWGGAGSILVIIGMLSGGLLSLVTIVGFILIAIAATHIAYFTDNRIRNDIVTAVVLFIFGLATLLLTVLSALYSTVGVGVSVSQFSSPFQLFSTGFWIGLAISWVFFLTASIFLRRGYKLAAARLRIGTFETAGNLFIVGAATLIILIGLVILFIAEILQIVAFLSIADELPTGPKTAPRRAAPQVTDVLEFRTVVWCL